MRTLLINPQMASGWSPNVLPRLGLSYLKASMVKADLKDVKIVDMATMKGGSISEIINTGLPEIVGISTLTAGRGNALKVATIAKGINQNIKVILGGAHPTIMYRQILENYPAVDIVCRGEGEATMVDLLQTLDDSGDLSKVKGIAYRQNGGVEVTEERGIIKNLDSLPFPDYSDLDLEEYRVAYGPQKGRLMASIVTSRGCPFSCSYCSTRLLWGKWRARSAQNVVDELEWLVSECGYDLMHFWDDILTVDKKRITDICKGILNRGLKFEWIAVSRADCVSLEMLEMMREAGCTFIAFGVESGSPSILKNYNKKEKIEDVVNAFAWCKKVGIKAHFNVMVGGPGETNDTIEETKDLIRKTKPDSITVALLRIYPGTALLKQAEEEGICDESHFLTDQECKHYTGAMSVPEMLQHAKSIYFMHARMQGLPGIARLAKLGISTLMQTPKEAILDLMHWDK